MPLFPSIAGLYIPASLLFRSGLKAKASHLGIKAQSMRILVTGASGLLGRAVFSWFKENGYDVRGLAYSRATEELIKVNLLDSEEVEDLVGIYRPTFVVHCAAERRPDVAEADPESAKNVFLKRNPLNITTSEQLATLSIKYDFRLVYICTDYVFDGHAPAGGYDVDAKPNPTNLYGETKLAGEQMVLKVGQKGTVTSLRVPVLYGKASTNSESAVNVIVDSVHMAASGKKVKQDDWAIRFPTLVNDVARVIGALCRLDKPFPSILHFSSQQSYTKYTMATLFAKYMGVEEKAIPNFERVTHGPGPGDTVRPQDCHLSNKALQDLGVDVTSTDFEHWWSEELKSVKVV